MKHPPGAMRFAEQKRLLTIAACAEQLAERASQVLPKPPPVRHLQAIPEETSAEE